MARQKMGLSSTILRIVTCGRNDVAALTMLVRKEMKASATALP